MATPDQQTKNDKITPEIGQMIEASDLVEVLSTKSNNSVNMLFKHQSQDILVNVQTSLTSDRQDLATQMAQILKNNFSSEELKSGAVLNKTIDGPANSKIEVEVICNPTDEQISKKSKFKFKCFDESYEDYQQFIEPQLAKEKPPVEEEKKANDGKLVKSEKKCEGFKVFEVKSLNENQFKYILQVEDEKIKCLRDLNGSHLGLLESAIKFKDSLASTVNEKYSNCAYIKYPAYRAPLEIIVTGIDQSFGPNMEYCQVRLVDEVYERIKLCSEFYQRATLDVKVPVDPKLELFEKFIESRAA